MLQMAALLIPASRSLVLICAGQKWLWDHTLLTKRL